MTDETTDNAVNTEEDGDRVANEQTKNESDTKEVTNQPKQRSVSFNRDVHVKRFGKPREARGASVEHQSQAVRREPFTHLSEEQLIAEANKVIEQADSVTCTADHPPEKFFSLPHRRKLKQTEQEKNTSRRNSDDIGSPEGKKVPLGRSTSDVGNRKKVKERTSLSTLFRKAQRNKSPDAPVVVATKPVAVVKRSKSDVSDLKSNTKLNAQPKPIRKRSGSETEEFLKSLRNKKSQLSPIIESSPREDYFKNTSPLDALLKQKLSQKNSNKSDEQSQLSSETRIVNPVEKPPRYKTPEKQSDPKPPARTKRGKSLEKENKEQSPPITDTPKRKTEIKKTRLVDEIDGIIGKDTVDVKDRIKDSIKKIQENVYGDKSMIHSSQQPPDKPPLTRGNTVGHLVRILKEDQFSPPPKAHLITPPNNGSNNNQPFSYIKPSISPDPNHYLRSTSPDRIPTPVNKMNNGKGVVYAQVVRGEGGVIPSNNIAKQTIHKTYSPPREKYGNISDEDEGLGYEDHKNKVNKTIKYDYNKGNENDNFNSLGNYNITDSPIRPRFREYKLTSFEDFEPTYANNNQSQDFVDTTFRGRGDGMDSKRKHFIEPETTQIDLDFNELSHRRHLLESRLNARKYDRERVNPGSAIRYITETDPIYEAEKRMKATEKYVNETAKYYRHTLERDGYTENSTSESYSKYNNDNHKIKYNTEKRTFEKASKDEVDRREYIDRLEPKEPGRFLGDKVYPPEPEYEPPSLELPNKNPILTPDEYKEKKYKVRNRQLTSSQDTLQTGQKYSKSKDSWFGRRKGHYSSNPEIAQEREEDYVNASYDPKRRDSYHNSLKREKHQNGREKQYKNHNVIKRHDSGDSRDYYREERSPRRFEIDNRLVDSGIENDFRKDSSGEIHRSNTKLRRNYSDDDVRGGISSSLFLASERQHTEDNYPSEQIYANGQYLARFEEFPNDDYHRKRYVPREMSADDGSHFDPRLERFDKSPSRQGDKLNAKPPKAVKKLSGLEKVKQLFSRDSSKKSKKEKEPVQNKTRTRVLKSPEHLARRDSDYRRYKDPEPSDEDSRRRNYDPKGSDTERKYRSSDPESDMEKRHTPSAKEEIRMQKHYRDSEEERRRYEAEIREERHRTERREGRRYTGSSDRESDRDGRSPRTSDVEYQNKSRETSRKSRSMTADSLDSPALAERYRERRRLATPSPTPSPPRRAQPPPPPPTAAGNWFKSLDRLARKRTKNTKVQKESGATTEDESIVRKNWKSKPLNSPAKNLRFFGDTDQDSDANNSVTKPKSHSQNRHSTLRKTTSNSSTGIDDLDHGELSKRSYSVSNLRKDERRAESPRTRTYNRRNLHNISEIHSNSETESQFDRKIDMKPPMSPYENRSRSRSSSKVVGKEARKHGSRSELRSEERGSSSELRGSKQELSRELKQRRRTPANNSGESSTEGDSSHQSQRSVVYLHATTVGDIPDPGRAGRNRSRDDVSSINSSQAQVRTTAKSFSIFAPWTPRHFNDHHDVHYAQKPRRQSKPRDPPANGTDAKNLDRPSTLSKNKSYSQTTLSRRPQNQRLTSSSTTLYRKPEKRSSKENLSSKSTLSRSRIVKDPKKSQSSEVLNRDGDRERISRSISMPKDNNKKAGWFKLSNKNKKPEINSRVR